MLEVKGKPDRVLMVIGPFNTVFFVRRDKEVVARFHYLGVCFPLKEEARAALDENHPFGCLLVVPGPRRGSMSPGDDPFQPESFGLKEDLKELFF